MTYRIYKNSPKKYGFKNQIVIADGTIIKGHYVLIESSIVLPSHDPLHGFSKTVWFPVDKTGNTANDRDYEHDKEAQKITIRISENYDSRAIQSPIIVSTEGIVFSGNGRAMAGRLAAANNTDGAYIDFLYEYIEQYGFSLKDLQNYRHPRIVFEVDNTIILPYTPETFARFNSQEMKSQNKTEKAIKLGKVIDDKTYQRIINNINMFDTLGDFYADKEASFAALQELLHVGVINQMEWPEMEDDGVISDDAKALLENVLVGKSFVDNPDVVRKINSRKLIRKAITTSLMEISKNSSLGEFSLGKELSEAVSLTVDALNAGYAPGDTVSSFARQVDMFTGETAGDYRNELVGIIANALNSKKTTILKRIFKVYNSEASQSAAGQTDMFSSGLVRSRDEILRDCAKMFRIKGAIEQKGNPSKNGLRQMKSMSDILRYLAKPYKGKTEKVA